MYCGCKQDFTDAKTLLIYCEMHDPKLPWSEILSRSIHWEVEYTPKGQVSHRYISGNNALHELFWLMGGVKPNPSRTTSRESRESSYDI